MVGGRVSGGPVSLSYTKFRWNKVDISGVNCGSGKLHGVIRVEPLIGNTGRLGKYSEVVLVNAGTCPSIWGSIRGPQDESKSIASIET